MANLAAVEARMNADERLLRAREADRQYCRELFEQHAADLALDLKYSVKFACYTDNKTQVAWLTWCAAMELHDSYLDPKPSVMEWWIRRPMR